MDFNDVASNIIEDSINSAVFIDDKVLLAFEEVNDNFNNPSELVAAFQEKSCNLDIYRVDESNWKSEKKYLFKNRDLIILDWKLNDNDDSNSETFAILDEIIKTQSLHFCCIYTDNDEHQLYNEVIYSILAYYILDNTLDLSQIKSDFEDLCGPYADLNNILDDIGGYIKEVLIEENKGNDIAEQINLIRDYFNGLGIFEEFNDFVNNVLPNGFQNNLFLTGAAINNLIVSDDRKEIRFASGDDKTIIVNNTIIKVRNKAAIGNELYEDFKNSLISDHNIFLTLLALELRRNFIDSSSFIGNELENVDETVFFYHKKNVFNNEEFYEFLKGIWKDQVSSFTFEKEQDVFKVLDQYITIKGLRGGITNFRKRDPKNLLNLARINAVYNLLSIKRNSTDKIKFGDVFLVKSIKSRKKWSNINSRQFDHEFLICLTPICDCIRPEENVKNQFHFIGGKQKLLNECLSNVDKNFYSFIIYHGQPISIEWKCKPFSLYIPLKNNIIANTINVVIEDITISMEYIATLKENYCQRIANHSFTHPTRVGISFASTKKRNN